MKLKKVLAAAMISLLATTALVGCGSDKKSADTGKKVQIEYWHVAAESFGGATVKELVADFNKTHPNIEVVEKYNPDMYKGLTQNLQAAMASGKNPDVVQMGYSFLNYAAENFKYTDLNEAFKAAGDENFMKDNYLPNVLQLAQTEDGKQIGLPYSVSVPVLFYNPEIFEKAGLDPQNPPKTWEEVSKAAKQIKDKTSNMGFFMQEYADKYLLFDDISEAELKVFEETFTKLIKISLWNTHGTQFLSKNPPHTGRVKELVKMFPNAKFIYLMRNPYTVFESTRSFFTNTIQPLKLQDISNEELQENILSVYAKLYHKYEADKKFIPEGNLVEVRFEDYETNAFDMTQEIYQKLQIPGFEDARADIEAYVNKKKGYKKNKYQYKPETVELVEKNWSFALEQWGYKL